ncbi:minor tail protein [Gordonia phage Dogfish]|nr:minor tail protein [Gordonia phage Dogfish]
MWSPAGPDAATADRLGWTLDGPATPPPAPVAGWSNVLQALASDGAATTDAALVDSTLAARDGAATSDSLYMGLDPANDFEVRIRVRDHALTLDRAAMVIDERALDAAAASDRLRVGVRVADSGAFDDIAVLGADIVARDTAALADGAAVRVREFARDAGALGDSATAAFAPMPPSSTTFSSVGAATFPIPVWCRFVSYAILGGGGGGGRHNSFSVFTGRGGAAGEWQTGILERGVHIPWTATAITVTVGTAGSGGALNGTAGGATTISIPGVGTVTAPGGAGGLGDQNGSPTSGGSPGDVEIDGQTYAGGTGGLNGTGSRQPAAGTAPGAGGGGGGGGLANGQQNGANGAIGRAWLRARQ